MIIITDKKLFKEEFSKFFFFFLKVRRLSVIVIARGNEFQS